MASMRQMRTVLGAGEQWLAGLDAALQQHNMTTQICGSGPADLMLSTNLPSITQARASIDSDMEFEQEAACSIGSENCTDQNSCKHCDGKSVNGLHNVDSADSAWLFWATGVAPSKDNFWSTDQDLMAMQTAGYKNDSFFTGKDCELQAIAALLSTSCFGLGDFKVSNGSLIQRAAMVNGLLLKPDRPLSPLDAMFSARDGPARTSASGCTGLDCGRHTPRWPQKRPTLRRFCLPRCQRGGLSRTPALPQHAGAPSHRPSLLQRCSRGVSWLSI